MTGHRIGSLRRRGLESPYRRRPSGGSCVGINRLIDRSGTGLDDDRDDTRSQRSRDTTRKGTWSLPNRSRKPARHEWPGKTADIADGIDECEAGTYCDAGQNSRREAVDEWHSGDDPDRAQGHTDHDGPGVSAEGSDDDSQRTHDSTDENMPPDIAGLDGVTGPEHQSDGREDIRNGDDEPDSQPPRSRFRPAQRSLSRRWAGRTRWCIGCTRRPGRPGP